MAPELEWDEEKRRANLAKHGVEFADLVRFDWDHALILPEEVIDGEIRHRELGALDDRILYVVYVERPPRTRIVSARVATRRERNFYVGNA